MNSLPDITLVATVYFPPGPDGELRERGFCESIASWRRRLRYDAALRLLVVNDGLTLGLLVDWDGLQAPICHPRSGAGGSLNIGFQAAFECSPLALNIDDDWLLTEPVDLSPWARVLMENEKIGAVHLAPYPGCTGTIEPTKGGAWVVTLDRHNLAAGVRACLYHRRFFDAYGWFPENCSAWESERIFNEHFCHSQGPDSVLALPLPWKEGIGAVVRLGQVNPCTSQ